MAAPKLRIVDPPHEPPVFEIPDGGSTIGRGGECTFVIAAKSVSRVHARFERRGEALSLEDLGSRNGTRVNGVPLSGTIAIHAGDRIRFGGVETLVEQEADELGETVLAPEAETVLAKPPPTLEIGEPGLPPASEPASTVTPTPTRPPPPTATPTPAAPDPAAATRIGKAPTPPAASPAPAPAPYAPSPPKPERSAATATSSVEHPTPVSASGPSLVELALIAIAAYAVVVGAGLFFWRGY